jgi:signal transduction histidine kinase
VKWELNKKWRLLLAGLWLLLTFSLSAWWMILGLNQSTAIQALTPLSDSAARQYRMFLWEGSFLLAFVSLGGLGLFYSIYWDEKRNAELRQFFSTFTHELKTSLTSLRLQAEILEEDPRNRENENLRRLLRDVVRLELQLENALVLAQSHTSKLFLEEIPLGKTVQAISAHWPQLDVKVERDARVRADQRAFECILKNLFQNASVHGQATTVSVRASSANDKLSILVADNGKGFAGNPEQLGASLVRHTTRSGAGVGLYLSRLLASRMGGSLSFSQPASAGLEARLELNGRLL